MYYFSYNTKIGYLTIIEREDSIIGVEFGRLSHPEGLEEETPLLKEAIQQIREYLEGSRRDFQLPISLSGTPFQIKVWNALKEIPYGETRSYKYIAESIEKPKAYRAVGNANNKNPISIIIP
jgi:methylated-DNA-[protein]-cysteine S-methyltransferase